MRRATSLLTMVRALALCAVTMSLCGCATLTVDVDMYKGPLSNHELVQAEQLSATIIGVKPILLGLRNDLEWGEEGLDAYKKKWLKEHTEALQWRRDQEVQRVVPLSVACPEQQAWKAYREFELALTTYEHDFWPVPAPGDTGLLWLTDPNAIRVNAVLGLYHDVAAEDMRSHVAEILRCVERVRACQAVLKPHENSDRAFWEGCENRFTTEECELDRPLPKTISACAYDTLREAYQGLLYPGQDSGTRWRARREVTGITHAHNFILDRERDTSILKPFGGDERAPQADAPAIAQFRWLENGAAVRAHARLLFGGNDLDFEKRFVERVRNIAEQFSRRREAVSDLLCASLSLIENVNAGQSQSAETGAQITRIAVDLASSLIKCEMLNAAVQSDSAPASAKGLQKALEAYLKRPLVPVNDWSAAGDARIPEYQEAIATLLRRDPVVTSRQLRILHLAFMGGRWEFPCSKSGASRYGDPVRREAGIALADPSSGTDSSREDPYDKICGSLAGLVRWSSGAGWDRGRLPEGLEALVDDYLMQVRHLPPPQDRMPEDEAELTRVRSRLANGLVHFGEKVLVIANYDTLLRGPEKKGLLKLTGWQEKRIRPYIDVLQAVGNSIIVQANELSAKTEHGEKLRQAWWRESRAMEYGFAQAGAVEKPKPPGGRTADNDPDKPSSTPSNPATSTAGGDTPRLGKTSPPSANSPAGVASDGNARPEGANQSTGEKPKEIAQTEPLLVSVRPLVDPNFFRDLEWSGDAKEVLDSLIAVLRYRYAAEVLKSGLDSEQTRNTAAALQTLYEQRADMVYIRPSSAYLRSSYPATSLQQDPEYLGDQNLLVRGVRSVWQMFDKERRQQQRQQFDIDKQYWQNVNQIRVSAAGGSNYVVVKDDVGNWYIKGYGADPCCVIQGVRSAALLAAAGGGAIASGAEFMTVKGGQRPASPTPSTSPQVEQIKKIDEAYREQLKTDLAALVKDVNGLAAQLCSRWAADPNTKEHFKKPVVEEANKSLVDRCRHLKDSKDPNEVRRVVAVFTAIRTFNDKVDAKIAGLPPDAAEKNKNEAIKTKARDIAKRTVCDFLMPRIERCASAVQHQEMVLLVLGTSQGKQADSGPSSVPPKPGSKR